MDTIANLLSSIRNAEMAGHQSLLVPASKINLAILKILKDNKYLENYKLLDEEKPAKIEVITNTTSGTWHRYKRISKPGRRIYTESSKIPIVRRGFGMVILSTSAGLMSGRDAKKKNLGGEIICEVY